MLLLLIFIHSSLYLRIPSLQIRQTSASKKSSGYGSTNTRTKMARLEPSSFKDEFRVEAMQTRASYVSACLSDEISRIRRTFRDLYPIVHCGHIFVLFPRLVKMKFFYAVQCLERCTVRERCHKRSVIFCWNASTIG